MESYWKVRAIWALRNYESRKAAIVNLPEEIAQKREAMTALRSPGADNGGGHGGGGRSSDRLDSLMDEITDMEGALRETRHIVKQTERALAALTEEERTVLEAFYIHRREDAVDELSKKMCISRNTVYVRRDSALARFRIGFNGR